MGISGRIARAFLQSQLTPLIALVALLLGTFAVIVTPKEEEPQINVTMANVFIPFPGASAKDVETLVATPAEQVLSQVQGLEHVYSVSRPGVAILTVQYKVGVGREAALVRLWDAIHANRDWVSAQLGVGEPIIKAKGIDDVPIVALTLSTADSRTRRLRSGARGARDGSRAETCFRHPRSDQHRWPWPQGAGVAGCRQAQCL
jgi:multidrug efflux pump subunit AcrB